LTAYDFTSAKLIDAAGVDVILVGDSLGSVIQGLETTLPVTLEEVIYHSRCVTRAARRALVVGDLPFLSYQVSIERAIESAGRLLKEGGVSAVKLEGGLAMSETIRRIVELDIPVMGHVGLTPQSFHRMGGHKVQGRQSGSSEIAGTRERVLEDALAVERAGAFACVLEGIPADLGREITAALAIPTIGIGAGADCDGQILVSTDLLGMSTEPSPKFVKRYAELAETITSAVATYAAEVRDGAFPGDEHSFRGNGAGTAKPSKLKLAK
jgi:3-methyl-2-oxobutanoate hydroxymethyltransferase